MHLVLSEEATPLHTLNSSYLSSSSKATDIGFPKVLSSKGILLQLTSGKILNNCFTNAYNQFPGPFSRLLRRFLLPSVPTYQILPMSTPDNNFYVPGCKQEKATVAYLSRKVFSERILY